jgi:thiol-disulfide isomerase/thioredoxin
MAKTSSPKPKPYPSNPAPKRMSSGLALGLVIGALVLIIGIVAIVLSAGGDDDTGGSADLSQTQPVEVAGATLPTMPDSGSDPAVGLTPPKLDGRSFDGSAVTIDPADGRNKMVVFLAHWCPHCQKELPNLVEWKQQGNQPADLDMYAVATGTNASAPNYPPSSWLAEEGWTDPVLADSTDSTAAAAYGLRSYPFAVIVGADGKVLARHAGEFTDISIDDFVNGALGGA